ncbi:kinesin-like protein KIF25 [Dugong dugon]
MGAIGNRSSEETCGAERAGEQQEDLPARAAGCWSSRVFRLSESELWAEHRPEGTAVRSRQGSRVMAGAQREPQLQPRVRVKEERIVELEAENAILHLKLAEYQEMVRKSHGEAARVSALCGEQQCVQKRMRAALVQLYHTVQKLKQDVREIHSSSLVLVRDFQAQSQDWLSEIVTAAHSTQLCSEALQACQSRAARLEQALQEISAQYHLEKQTRKALHNSLVELRGNIRVHCRIRPLLPFDHEFDDPASQNSPLSGNVVHAVDDETVLVKCSRPGHPLVNKTYTFERVYGPAEAQDAVFADVRPLLTSLLDGYNVCIMAYGQTGSGKSYTMLGPQSEDHAALPLAAQGDLGVTPRAAEELFRLISENPLWGPEVEVSVVEVYNNEVFDLLAKDTSPSVPGAKCDGITPKAEKKELSVATSELVNSAAEFMRLVERGQQLRVRHPTLVHADSSRSHLIITVTLPMATSPDSSGHPSDHTLDRVPPCRLPQLTVREKPRRASSLDLPPGAGPEDSPAHLRQVRARLQLVDLAGSECAGVSGVTGLALREASCINRSLAALGDVLGALWERRGHVPYRNSRLTHLLQDAIGGDAKLLVVLCVSPCREHLAATLQSLGFGARARQVQRGRAGRRGQPAPRKTAPGVVHTDPRGSSRPLSEPPDKRVEAGNPAGQFVEPPV